MKSNDINKNGVLYIVTTNRDMRYLNAAIESAKSVCRHSPGLKIHLYSDQNGLNMISDLNISPFDSMGLIKEPHYRSKVDYISKSPFINTLYLDSDTRIMGDISEMYVLLERFDIALAHAHRRYRDSTNQKWRMDIPCSFPQYNGGVILFRNCDKVISFLKLWGEDFHNANFIKDQVTLRELLWLSDLQISTLPPEYNLRYKKYLKIWDKDEAKVKILHMAEFHKVDLKGKLIKSLKKSAYKCIQIYKKT